MKDFLGDFINGILKTADDWYNNGWMWYILIGLVALIGWVLWKR